jgi:hypothetical protein
VYALGTRILLFGAALLVVCSASFPLLAQPEGDLVRARQLYSQGLTQEAAGDWAGALATFQEVARIKLTPQVRFHVARSKENLGRLNEALGGYRLAEYEASQGGAKEQEILAEVSKAREALEQRIPKLVIVRGKNAGSIKVELDGVVLGDPQVGKEITVDPGPHVVAGIVAPGKRFKSEVSVAEGGSARVVLDVPEAMLEPTAVEPEPTIMPTPSAPGPDTAPAREKQASSRVAPWIVGGLGVAALVASGVFYALRSDAQKELDAGCLGRTCPDTLRDTQSRGETYAALSGVMLGVGIAGVGASAIMLLGGGSQPESPGSPAAAVGMAPRRVSVSLGGRF